MSQETAVVQQQLRPHERLVEAVAGMDYGDPITHETIGSIIGERAGTNKYRSTVRKASRILLDKGKMLENIRGIGYRVTRAADYVPHALYHFDKGKKEIKRGRKILENIPMNKLTAQERSSATRVKDKFILIDAFMSGSSVEVKLLAKEEENPLAPENTNRR